jgi:site-specific recombinase XerC
VSTISRLMPAGFTMHTLRHRFATRAYRGSRNLRAVQGCLVMRASRRRRNTPPSMTTRAARR